VPKIVCEPFCRKIFCYFRGLAICSSPGSSADYTNEKFAMVNWCNVRFLIKIWSKSLPEQGLRIYFDAKSPFYSNNLFFLLTKLGSGALDLLRRQEAGEGMRHVGEINLKSKFNSNGQKSTPEKLKASKNRH